MHAGRFRIPDRESGVLFYGLRFVMFLVFSLLATGFSWLFYFRDLQMTTASLVVSIDKLSVVFALPFVPEELLLDSISST